MLLVPSIQSTVTMSSLDVFTLLTFPSKTNGLSSYKPGLTVPDTSRTRIPSSNASPTSGSDSPPRKTARLEGYLDHTDSGRRRKGKEREAAVESTSDSVIKLTLVDPPGMF